MEIHKMVYIDVKTGLSRIRNNMVLYRRLLNLFLTNKSFDAFEKALEDNDIQAAADQAHAIKGAVGNIALEPLFQLSSKLMVQLREGIRDEEVIAQYREVLTGTRAAVEAYLND
jgi:HPt (histidine-containing phosphotransfer) domain-containing protein